MALAASIRKQIEAAAEAKIALLPDEKGRWRKVAEIEKEARRSTRAGRRSDSVDSGRAEGRRQPGLPTRHPDLGERRDRRSSGLLGGTAAVDDRDGQASCETRSGRKKRRNQTLQTLNLEAELRETKLDWQRALELRKQVVQVAPDWFLARDGLGVLLLKLARFSEAEPHLRGGSFGRNAQRTEYRSERLGTVAPLHESAGRGGAADAPCAGHRRAVIRPRSHQARDSP